MVQVGIYVRISDDHREKQGLGIKRQCEDCVAIAKAPGWEVADVYADNDLSAYKKDVIRPEFERLLEDLQAGVNQGVVTYDIDRFIRQPRGRERTLEIYEEHQDLVFSSVQQDINLGTDDGQAMARVLVTFAYKSSRDTSRRVARRHLANALDGRPVGGPPPVRLPIQQDRSRTCRGPAHPTGGPGRPGRHSAPRDRATVEHPGCCDTEGQALAFYQRPSGADPPVGGFVRHQGELLRGADGEPVRGCWESILDEVLWEQLQAVFSDPSRRTNHNQGHTPVTGGSLVTMDRFEVLNAPVEAGGRRVLPVPAHRHRAIGELDALGDHPGPETPE